MDALNPTDLAAAQEAREKAEREQQKRREQERDDFKRVMADAWGRRFVWRLMGEAGVFRSSFVPGDALAGAFAEGQRQQGLRLVNEVLAVCPEHWLTMIREQKT